MRANVEQVLDMLRHSVNASGKFHTCQSAVARWRPQGGDHGRYETVEQLFVHLVRDYSRAGADARAQVVVCTLVATLPCRHPAAAPSF